MPPLMEHKPPQPDSTATLLGVKRRTPCTLYTAMAFQLANVSLALGQKWHDNSEIALAEGAQYPLSFLLTQILMPLTIY